MLKREVDMGTPMVFLDRAPVNLAADSVVHDNEGGAREGIAQLIEQGHRRIGMVFNSLDLVTMRQRFDGARSALAVAGIPFDDNLVIEGRAWPGGLLSGSRATARLRGWADGDLLR